MSQFPIVLPPTNRFLSEKECAALATRVATFRHGGGESRVQLESWWRGTMRFARNQIQSSGDRRNNDILITRNVEGAERVIAGNQIDDTNLRAMVLRAERLLQFDDETGDARFQAHVRDTTANAMTAGDSLVAGPASDTESDARPETNRTKVLNATALPPEPFTHPKLFFESTLAMSSPRRAQAVAPLVAGAVQAGMHAAGDIEVAASGTAIMDTWGNHLYYPKTDAYYTVTVRSPDGTASGWAGVDWNDWSRIEGVRLSEIALDKCLRSKNPVRVEPGRYTTILEPQAVHQMFWPIIGLMGLLYDPDVAFPEPGKKSVDERITVRADPMDPDCGFLPFDLYANVYHAATWFERGRTKDFPYTRLYGMRRLHKNTGLPNSGAYHMEGGSSTIEEMIATTQRGIYVTHFALLTIGNPYMSVPTEGFTRDGTWLIENGKITKAVKNMKFTALHFPTFNRVEQIGSAQRVFHEFDGCPAAIAPSMKVQDFNFTALTDAV